MKLQGSNIPTQYIINKQGQKTAVVIDITVFKRLLEELEDMYDVVEAEKNLKNNAKTYTLEEVKKAFSVKKAKKAKCKK